ncbi:MAG TPA: hypothetical protein VFB19_04200 [Mycobacterium sp.]|nr:hypothetical protein [Mycobacterium sp.]
MEWLVVAGFLVLLGMWFYGIWLGYQARRRHRPPDGRDSNTSSDPSLL